MRKLRYALLTFGVFGCLGLYMACTSSDTGNAAPAPAPYVVTVSALITPGTSETDEPKELSALDLTGIETEDEHAFDALFPPG